MNKTDTRSGSRTHLSLDLVRSSDLLLYAGTIELFASGLTDLVGPDLPMPALSAIGSAAILGWAWVLVFGPRRSQ